MRPHLKEVKKVYKETTIGNKYVVDGYLGEGGFCIVFKGHKIGCSDLVAIKRTEQSKTIFKNYNKEKRDTLMFNVMMKEIKVLRALKHPNLIQLLDTVETDEYLYMVMEYADGGDLSDLIRRKKRLPEPRTKIILQQIILGIQYMHKVGYVHRDIKAENVLFSDSTLNSKVKVTDFGLSVNKFNKVMTTNCGTFTYSAPELLKNRFSHKGYTYKVDNWAIGVLTYYTVSGRLPYFTKKDNSQEYLQLIKENNIMNGFPWNFVTLEGRMFIRKLLDSDPNKRLELKDALRHYWITEDERYRPIALFPRMEFVLKSTLSILRWRILFNLAYLAVMCKKGSKLENKITNTQRETTVTDLNNK